MLLRAIIIIILFSIYVFCKIVKNYRLKKELIEGFPPEECLGSWEWTGCLPTEDERDRVILGANYQRGQY